MKQRLHVPADSADPDAAPARPPRPNRRSIPLSLLRGLLRRCPNCGVGTAMEGYLRVKPACPHCGEALGHIRADDGPAYFTMLISGHIVVPLVLVAEQLWHPPLYPLLAVAVLGMVGTIWQLLPRVKGAVLGLMWALGLKGDEVQGDLEHHG